MAFEYAGHVWRKGCDPEFWKRYIRHPIEATKAARKQPEVRRNMLAYAKLHPVCEATGLKPIQVHHVLPAANFPKKAADMDNFISLHQIMHMKLIGHPRGTKSYNEHVRRDALVIRDFLAGVKENAIVTKSHKWFQKQITND